MAGSLGNTSTAVIERIRAEPWRFDFFAAILWLERLQHTQGTADAAVGTSQTPDREKIHFRSLQQQSFASSDLVEVKSTTDHKGDQDWHVTVSMMGLTGPNGILPGHYSRLVMEQVRKADRESDGVDKNQLSALPDYFNLFNHRQISLFYRAWKKYRLEAMYTRRRESDESSNDDPVSTVLYSLVGLANGQHGKKQSLRERNDFADEAVLYYAGAFARWPRSTNTLKNLIAEMFQLQTDVIEFQPQWCNLRPEDQYRVSPPGRALGQDSALGISVMIGSLICLYDTRFRIRLGPLSRKDFDRLLPEGDRLRAVIQFARLYVGPQWDFDIQLVLKKEEVPMTRLGGSQVEPSQLARNSWSLNAAPHRDQDQVVLRPEELN